MPSATRTGWANGLRSENCLGSRQRYTDLGTLYIARAMHFFLQGVSNTGASVTLPPLGLIFIPTHSFRVMDGLPDYGWAGNG